MLSTSRVAHIDDLIIVPMMTTKEIAVFVKDDYDIFDAKAIKKIYNHMSMFHAERQTSMTTVKGQRDKIVTIHHSIAHEFTLYFRMNGNNIKLGERDVLDILRTLTRIVHS